ncbi:ABC transporter substrate-binding protein [Natrinema longum]|uniref:ABC transporter substrate-binding protein n=1 Tax=Natrinema longum TaxID=370324 RepID=A0A8A2UCV8_9EURY|nr:ABC transporter substrate-binding protein [Natrinema longum]MBZ6495471.1 ABC transporter substrate-binding protein [Natrinema longum]QSW86559.1 ABC transporter substrate-binding protein [Natrinema longum]
MTERNRRSGEPKLPSSVDGRPSGLDRRTLLKTGAGGVAGVSFAGCLEMAGMSGGNSDGPEPVKIGVLAPNPKRDTIGQSIVRGAEVAVTELQDNGGIDGRDVELVVGDTNESPLEGRREYQRLTLEEDVDVTVGVFASEVLMNIIDDIAKQETLHLTSGAATTAASELVKNQYEDYKYHFRVGPNNDYDLGRMQMDFLNDMASDIGWNSIAVLAEDYDWTEKPWEVYQERLPEMDIDVAMERRYPAATDDFSEIYSEVADAEADAAFITTAHTGNSALSDWSNPRDRSEPQPFAFGGIHVPMQLPSYYELVDGACEYGVMQNSASKQSTRSETQAFIELYENQYDGESPVYTGYHAYDAVTLFANAVEESGTVDSTELVPVLEEFSFTGAAGTIEFYGSDHDFPHDLRYNASDPDPVYLQWQEDDDGNGVQEIIWPEAQATADYIAPPWL